MQFTIKIKQPLRAEETAIDPGAVIILNKASRPIISLLRYYFLTKPESIAGSRAALTHLMNFPGQPEDLDGQIMHDYIKKFATNTLSEADKSAGNSSPEQA